MHKKAKIELKKSQEEMKKICRYKQKGDNRV